MAYYSSAALPLWLTMALRARGERAPQWEDYDQRISSELEVASMADEEYPVPMSWTANKYENGKRRRVHFRYEILAKSLVQRNVDTGTERPIRRILLT